MSSHHKRRVVNYTSLLRKHAVLVFSSLAMVVGIQPASLADPPQGTTRKIVSDDFTKNRPGIQGQSSNDRPKKLKSRRTYRLASSTSKTRPISRASGVAQLGITIWKLRPVAVNDTASRVLVREKGKSSEWVPERVESGTTLREGDHVRLSIESPNAGYLYVVGRDLFADGTRGRAMLIYPWLDMRGGNNQVRPGKLIDIPAQEDDPSYFTARPSSQNQVGEILTIIVTKSPLNLPISDEPLPISAAEMTKWEKIWGAQSERFEMEGGAGQAWTKQEQQAGSIKGTRQLTRDDPAPQTIYRLHTKNKTGFLVDVRLSYAR
jgi:hypothetical protein